MQSVDEFTPSTTEPVFGSGLISQTKTSSTTNNDTTEHEKSNSSSEPIVNGQNDVSVNKTTSNESITNGTTENAATGDSSTVHVNGQNEKPIGETNNDVNSSEKSNHEEPVVAPTEPKPVSSTPEDTPMEVSSSVPTSTVDNETTPLLPPADEPPTTTSTANDTVPEVPVANESKPAETKTKAPRGRAVKEPVVSTTPTRQSARGRKPASSSTTNVDENPTTDDASTTNQIETSSTTTSSQPTSTTDVTMANDDVTEGNTTNVSPSTTSKKRGAPITPATKKAKGKGGNSSVDDVDSGVAAVGLNESETVETPPKKARTSATKKTPEPPTEDYARKLRPRK